MKLVSVLIRNSATMEQNNFRSWKWSNQWSKMINLQKVDLQPIQSPAE